MGHREKLSSEILGQISLMQSVVAQLPDRKSMIDFVCRGFKDVPGVLDVKYRLNRKEISAPVDFNGLQFQYQLFHVSCKERKCADLLFRLSDPDAFSPYIPFIENFSNMLGVIFEEQRQRRLNQSIMADLESRVMERTRELSAEIAERKKTVAALQASHERFLTVLNGIDATIYVADMETHEILFMNQHMIENFGRNMTGEICWKVFRAEPKPCSQCPNDKLVDGNGKPAGVCVWHDMNPVTGKWYINYDRAIEWTDGRLVKLQIATDITDLKRMEDELRQAHKMESVGTLAGGIAHEFNNILGIILSNTELALDDVPEGNPARSNLDGIKTACLRARDVVRQLLTFSRKSEQQRRPLNIIPIIHESIRLLRASIPTSVEIRSDIADDTGWILADPIQMQQVIINLATNAAQAMEHEGGVLKIGLKQIAVDGGTPLQNPANAGQYIQLTVSDTGPGIDPTIQNKIFDPYFTTREVGKGSGMGLAIVHSIIENHDGVISLTSEPGKGTTLSILLPVRNAKWKEKKTDFNKISGGSERILLVDDEASIAKMGARVLSRLGYQVETRLNPVAALELFRSNANQFDLVITDMTMPQMNGAKLSQHLKAIRPDIPIIICTGYNSQIDEVKAEALGIAALVKKPVLKDEIDGTIRRVLGEKKH